MDKPGIVGVVDGVADWLEFRADRLRGCGNGVVPLQAAVALLALADRALVVTVLVMEAFVVSTKHVRWLLPGTYISYVGSQLVVK